MKKPTGPEGGAPPRAPVDVRDRDALEAWLRTKPREASVAFAARAALRVLPLITVEDGRRGEIADLILATFRATAVAIATARHPTAETKLSGAADAAGSLAQTAAETAIAVTSDAYDPDAAVAFVAAAAAATAAASYPATAGYAADAAAAAVAAAADKISAGYARNSGIRVAMVEDIAAIDMGLLPVSLSRRPLWSPMPAVYAGGWQALRRDVRVGQTGGETDTGPTTDAREDRDVLLALVLVGHHVADDARRGLELVEFLARVSAGLGAVGGYAALNNYTALGGTLTVFSLPNE